MGMRTTYQQLSFVPGREVACMVTGGQPVDEQDILAPSLRRLDTVVVRMDMLPLEELIQAQQSAAHAYALSLLASLLHFQHIVQLLEGAWQSQHCLEIMNFATNSKRNTPKYKVQFFVSQNGAPELTTVTTSSVLVTFTPNCCSASNMTSVSSLWRTPRSEVVPLHIALSKSKRLLKLLLPGNDIY